MAPLIRKQLSVGCSAVLLAWVTLPAWAAGGSPTKPASEQAREYVLAACLLDKYRGTPLAHEVELWAQGLVEHGSLGGEAYPALTQLAKRLAPPPAVAQNGTPMLLQSCLELYNSIALKKAVKRVR